MYLRMWEGKGAVNFGNNVAFSGQRLETKAVFSLQHVVLDLGPNARSSPHLLRVLTIQVWTHVRGSFS